MAMKLEDSQLKIDYKYAGPAVPYTHYLIQQFDTVVRKFFRDVPGVVKWKFKLTGAVYKLSFEHADGRKWKQDIDFEVADPANPAMDFNTGSWHLDEFRPHRAVRDVAVKLRNELMVTEIDVDRM